MLLYRVKLLLLFNEIGLSKIQLTYAVYLFKNYTWNVKWVS